MHCEQCGAATDRGRRRCRDCSADGTPTGVRVAAALAGGCGFATAVLGLVALRSGPPLLLAAPFGVGLGLAQGAVARGLWNREYWAWGWGVSLYALSAVLALGLGALAGGSGTTDAVTAALLAGLLAAYIYGRHPWFTPDGGPAAAGR
jgi:hypothetical protein